MKRYTEKKAAIFTNKILNQARRNRKEKINGERIYKYFVNAWKDENDNCIACDGYRIAKLYNGFPAGITEIWSCHVLNNEQLKEMEYRHKIAIDYTFNSFTAADLHEVNIPSIDYIRNNKTEDEYFQLPGDKNFPFFAAYWLIDVLNVFPDCKWYIMPEKGKKSPLYVKDNNGECFIMPVYIEKNN